MNKLNDDRALDLYQLNEDIDNALENQDFKLYKESFLKLGLLEVINDVAFPKLADEVYRAKDDFERYAIDYRAFMYKDYKNDGQVFAVVLGLRSKLDTLKYNEPDRFDSGQMYEIQDALSSGINVHGYNNPERYSHEQMKFIFKGIRAGLDVSQYDTPELNSGFDMKQKYLELKNEKLAAEANKGHKRLQTIGDFMGWN